MHTLHGRMYHRLVIGLVMAALCLGVAPAFAASLVAGLGVSNDTDPAVAGEAAARDAQQALRGDAPKIVLLFTAWPAKKSEQPYPEKNYPNVAGIVDGVAKVFPRELVFGGDSYQAITNKGKGSSKVAVLALGGEQLSAKTAAVPCWFWCGAYATPEAGHGLLIQDKWKVLIALPGEQKTARYQVLKTAGKTLGDALEQPKKENSLLILLGDMHVPASQTILEGVQDALGKDFPIIGAAFPPDYACYVGGQVKPASIIGILLSAPMQFSAIRATGNLTDSDQPGTSDALVALGTAPLTTVLDTMKTPTVVFAFDCLSRVTARTQYWPQVLKIFPTDSLLFGLVGSSEIGPETTGAVAMGTSKSIVYGALAPRLDPPLPPDMK